MKNSSITQTLLGLVIVGLGVGFLLDATNIYDFSSLLANWWPLLIIAVGVISLFNSPGIFIWPLVVTAVGVLLLLNQLGILEFNVWSLIWPSILIIFGLSFIFDRFKPTPKADTKDQVDLFTAFSGIETKNVSDDFKGGKLSAIFGGISLDLREAEIKEDIVIDAFAAFGGIDLRVPEGWNVHVSGLPILGGWDNKTKKPTAKNAPTVTVRGTCFCGGVDIKN